MSPQDDLPELNGLALEPDDLNGHTVEELSAYLDADRTPPDPSIDESPGCQLALQAMQRLRGLSAALAEADAEAEEKSARDEGWISRILGAIAVDARAGRRIPIAHPDPMADLGITEGAVRGIIRAAEDEIDGVIIGRCRFTGDVTVPDEPIGIVVDASVLWGTSLPTIADALRTAIRRRLAAHTDLNVQAVDVTIHDIHQLPAEEEPS
ncbi:hypothetical protein GCM10022288_20900 [Gryllotalpicola kribbensis]|uniref:Asp23/Gls24 family envelope stress response protein n=1 Tax=Gryllotalpicola kribbensis TaxID=993084 RepID=A0ABP8AUH4_9MICO